MNLMYPSMNAKNPSINVNCDLGEGSPFDDQIMPHIGSCNIACGGHAGDQDSMRRTVGLALKHGVQIGAHPSYPDLENFGREVIDIDLVELRKSLVDQIMALKDICLELSAELIHVKPHGALYNQCVKDRETAVAVLDAIGEIDPRLELYAPDRSVIVELALDRNMKVAYEVFADRNYNDDLSLVSRRDAGAMVSKDRVLDHVQRMKVDGIVKTLSGKEVPIKADTFCIHGDNPQALEILKQIQSIK